MSNDDKKEPGYVLGTETDGTDSFDTITALVAAGTDCVVLSVGVS